jgi:adenine-specific DNA methylase
LNEKVHHVGLIILIYYDAWSAKHNVFKCGQNIIFLLINSSVNDPEEEYDERISVNGNKNLERRCKILKHARLIPKLICKHDDNLIFSSPLLHLTSLITQ